MTRIIRLYKPNVRGRTVNCSTGNRQAASTVVIADNHPEVRQEIVDLLTPDFSVLEAVADGESLVRAVRELRPDLVLSDIRMPKLDGIQAGRAIIREGLCNSVVLLSMYADSGLVANALDAGIRGYVLKTDAGDDLISALNEVRSGGTFLSRRISELKRGS